MFSNDEIIQERKKLKSSKSISFIPTPIKDNEELKKLKKKKFEKDNEIELKTQQLIKLIEENNNLQIINKNLRNKLFEKKEFESLPLINKEEILEPIQNLRSDYSDDKITQLKEDIAESEIILRIKNRIMKEVKSKLKLIKNKIDDLNRESKQYDENIQIFKNELINDNNINNFTLDMVNSDENLHDNIEQEKFILEGVIEKLQSELKYKERLVDEKVNEYNTIEHEYCLNEKEYVTLSKRKFDITQKIAIIEEMIEKNDNSRKYVDKDITSIHKKLKENKNYFDKIEDDLSFKLYFIRFSNSFVRSFFNIINIRRLQIEMIKNLSKDDNNYYNFLFKKMDELEIQFIQEYKEYLSMHEEYKF